MSASAPLTLNQIYKGNLQLDQTDLNMLPQGMADSIYISSIGVMSDN